MEPTSRPPRSGKPSFDGKGRDFGKKRPFAGRSDSGKPAGKGPYKGPYKGPKTDGYKGPKTDGDFQKPRYPARDRDSGGETKPRPFFKDRRADDTGGDRKPRYPSKERGADTRRTETRSSDTPRFYDKDKRPERSGDSFKPRFDKPRYPSRDRDAGSSTRDDSKPRFDKPRYPARDRDASPDKDHKPRFPARDRNPDPSRFIERREKKVRIEPNGEFIWGWHAVEAAWINPNRQITRVWVGENGEKTLSALRRKAEHLGLERPEAVMSPRSELDRLLPPGSVHQNVIIDASPLPAATLDSLIEAETPPSRIVVLDQVTDPHNVGAILRSASAFGAGGVIITSRHAPQASGVMAKSASGAMDYMPLVSVVNLAQALESLRDAGYMLIGLAEGGEKSLHEIALSGRVALVLGGEGDGLRQLTRKTCDHLVSLPTVGAIGSLNVSNAAAVALYELHRQNLGKITKAA